jgi:nucleoside-diphosphate-sugar epimerase
VERKSSLENLVKMGFLNTYKGRKVLVTGHTGFKGGWLSLWLHHIGADVTGYSLDPEHPEGIFVLSDIGKKIKDYRGYIREVVFLIILKYSLQLIHPVLRISRIRR